MSIEAMKQALEALERGKPQITGVLVQQDQDAASTALRAAISDAEKQEPYRIEQDLYGEEIKLYTTPPAPEAPAPQPAVQEPVAHSVVAGSLFDFMGWLTSRNERLTLSGADEAGPAVEAITKFAKMRGLRLEDAQVEHWHVILTTPPAAQRQWVGLTDAETAECFEAKTISDRLKADAKRIEAKLKEKNHVG